MIFLFWMLLNSPGQNQKYLAKTQVPEQAIQLLYIVHIH